MVAQVSNKRTMLTNRFRIFDLSILFIFIFGPTFGSAITIMSCLMGILYLPKWFLGKFSNCNIQFKLIASVYTIYILYFLLSGFLKSEPLSVLVSMAPTLPLICFTVVVLVFDWENSKIDSKVVGISSTVGVSLCLTMVCMLLLFPFDLEISGRTPAEHANLRGRLELFSGNPLPFASMLVALGFFGLVGFSQKTTVLKILTLFGLLAIGLIIVFWSESRGSQISFLIMAFLTIFAFIRKKLFIFIKENFVISAFIFLLLFVFIFSVYNSSWLPVFGSNSSMQKILLGYNQLLNWDSLDEPSSLSVQARMELYKASLSVFLEKPIFGYGYDKIFSEVQARSILLQDFNFTHLHNSFLNHLIAGGLIGLIVLIMFISLPILLIYFSDQANHANVLFAILIFSHNIFSGLTNVYLKHDLLCSFNGVLPIILALSLVADKKASKLDQK